MRCFGFRGGWVGSVYAVAYPCYNVAGNDMPCSTNNNLKYSDFICWLVVFALFENVVPGVLVM